MKTNLLYPLVLCVISVALEGIFAGGDIRRRLAELRMPRYVPPLWGWVVIGLFYYAMCFAILHRLFSLPPETSLRKISLTLILALMLTNALWNYFFFRSRNLFHAWFLGLPYSAIAIALLLLLLLKVDRAAGFWLLPYLAYLFYANLWGYRVWKLNP